MNLRQFAFFADENIHPEVVAFLEAEGVDVLTIRAAGLLGASDSHVLKFANEQQRVIMTHDSDFGRFAIANEESFLGIVYLRPGHIKAQFTVSALAAVLKQSLDLTVPFIIVIHRAGSEVRVRIRSGLSGGGGPPVA